jgi:hypothetical protein
MNVANSEIDRHRHDGYLSVIGTYADPLGQALVAMATAAGKAARSREPSDFLIAVAAMNQVRERAATFLDQLASAGSPDYLRGADSQLQDALKLLMDGGSRGASAATKLEATQLTAAASEMEVANRDIIAAASRIANWRSGAARP